MVFVPSSDTRVHHFEHQARAILAATAVFIGALIGVLGPKLTEQIAVRTVNFDKIKARFARTHRCRRKIRHHLFDFIQARGARRCRFRTHRQTVFIAQRSFSAQSHSRSRNRRLTIWLQARVRHQTGVPQLHRDFAALIVHRLRDLLPRSNLLGRVQARRTGVAFGLRRHLRRLGHDQTSRCPLRIIGFCQWRRNIARLSRAQARQWRHHNAIIQLAFPQSQGFKQNLMSHIFPFKLDQSSINNC